MCQEERLKHKQSWASAVCCFVLFIVVCLSLTLNVKGAFRAAGHPEVGLLFFILPGAAASFFPIVGKYSNPSWCNVGGAVLPVTDAFRFYADAFIVARAGVVV
jgi:hypothetical protein